MRAQVLDREVFFNALLFIGAWALTHSGLASHSIKVLTFLCAVDFFTGVGKTFRLAKGFTSRRLTSGILAKCGVILIPISVGLALNAAEIADAHFFTTFILIALMGSETYSIIANVYTIKSGKIAKEWDVFSLLMKKIRETVERALGLS